MLVNKFLQKIKKSSLALSAFLVLAITGLTVLTAPPALTLAEECDYPNDTFIGIPAWYKYLPGDDSGGRCSPKLSDGDEGETIQAALPIGIAILEAILVIATYVAVAMFFWSGFNFINSEGNPEKVAGARKTAVNAVIGFVIVLISSQVVAFIGRTIGS